LKQSSETAFRARANWYEHGEKSNKYFLNLNKRYKKQKVIDNIRCEGISYKGQEEVNNGITGFYRKLYQFREVDLDDGGFYDNCPKLSQDKREIMENELTEGDLLMALNTCPDGAMSYIHSTFVPERFVPRTHLFLGPIGSPARSLNYTYN
jgi:hypothetical protein